MTHEIYNSKYDELITGAVKMMRPDIGLYGCTIEGDDPNQILITCNHRTKLQNITVVGSPHGQHRAIDVNATGIRIDGFRILNIFSHNVQAQGIAAWEGCQDLVVKNGEIWSAGENIIFGGALCSHERLIPQDIELENISLIKDPAWFNDKTIACNNFFEVKNGKRINMMYCSGHNSWAGGGQEGHAIVLTVRQDLSQQDIDYKNYFCCVEDIDIYGCDFSRSNGGLVTLGVDDRYPDSPMGLQNVRIRHNTFRQMGYWEPEGRIFMLNSGSENLEISSNRVLSDVVLNSYITFANDKYKNRLMRFSYNDVPHGRYGMIGENGMMGMDAWNHYTKDSFFDGNIITKRRENAGIQNGSKEIS